MRSVLALTALVLLLVAGCDGPCCDTAKRACACACSTGGVCTCQHCTCPACRGLNR